MSDVAPKRTKTTWTSKVCSNPTHGHKSKLTRQMHACSQCYNEFIQAKLKEDMEPSEIVRRATFEFRNYFCPFCLDDHKHDLASSLTLKCIKAKKSHCLKHFAINAQKTCPCGVLWRYCTKCDDYRAGTLILGRSRARRTELQSKLSVMAISNLIHQD